MSTDKFDKLDLGLVGIVAFVLGGAVTVFLTDYLYTPNSVFVRHLNRDGRPDLVVENRRGGKFPYLQQKDGSYRRFTHSDLLRELDEFEKQAR